MIEGFTSLDLLHIRRLISYTFDVTKKDGERAGVIGEGLKELFHEEGRVKYEWNVVVGKSVSSSSHPHSLLLYARVKGRDLLLFNSRRQSSRVRGISK